MSDHPKTGNNPDPSESPETHISFNDEYYSDREAFREEARDQVHVNTTPVAAITSAAPDVTVRSTEFQEEEPEKAAAAAAAFDSDDDSLDNNANNANESMNALGQALQHYSDTVQFVNDLFHDQMDVNEAKEALQEQGWTDDDRSSPIGD